MAGETHVELTPGDDTVALSIQGKVITLRERFPLAALDGGLVIELGKRVIVLLHRRAVRGPVLPQLGFVGESEAIDGLRRSILRVANMQTPVLLLGATGTGKELIARALHQQSGRRGAFVSLNVGTLSPALAGAELFGPSSGAFLRAEGGTLFLDELDEAPPEVLLALMRAVQTSTLPVTGGERAFDVRVIATGELEVERAELEVPLLLQRRDDLGRLIVAFMSEALRELGDVSRLAISEAEKKPWFPASVARSLILRDWPGNVRGLRNEVRQLILDHRDQEQLTSREENARLDERAGIVVEQPGKTLSGEVSEALLLETLAKHRWRIHGAAKELGITPSSLHTLLDRSANVRKAIDVAEEEVRRTLKHANNDINLAAENLHVSTRDLRLRMSLLGMIP